MLRRLISIKLIKISRAFLHFSPPPMPKKKKNTKPAAPSAGSTLGNPPTGASLGGPPAGSFGVAGCFGG